MMQMAALTTQSQIMVNTAAEMTASVVAAINQLAANQLTMQQQFAAFTMQCNTIYQWAQVVQPPITQFLIPNMQVSQQVVAAVVDVVEADMVDV